MPEPLPPIDYSSRDWQSLRADLISAKRTRMPEWTSESPNDFGIMLIELFAYMGDMLSFYQDRVANEAFLDTAVQRSSVYSIARMLDYRPTGLGSATTTLQFTTPDSAGIVTIPAGTKVQTVAAPGESPIIFETDIDLVLDGTLGVHADEVTATQGQTVVGEVIGASTGQLYQRFALFRSPVVDASVVVTVNETGSALQWVFFEHLIDAGPNDPAFTTEVDEGGITWIMFGDDVNGRVPVSGADIRATYRVADGAAGNVGTSTLVQLTAPVVVDGITQQISSVTNITGGMNGSDPESLESIRQNAPRSLTAVNRAVTTDDYAALARRVMGVGKALAEATSSTAVTVRIAPVNAPGSVASAAVKTAVTNYLEPRKMIGVTVTIGDPVYVPVDIEVDIQVLPTYRRQTVQDAVLRSLSAIFDYYAVDFGKRITLSRIYRAIYETEGVDYGTVSLPAADVVMTTTQIPTAGTITVNATGGIV
ncbi:MAG TPA: putative baseplate assembly protein [Gemmatimonadales bacterium]|nr:putative baseplate assembly protein [Gemmatimonadales bacterium]